MTDAIIEVVKDTVRFAGSGNTSIREVVRHPGGVSVCAVDHDLNVMFRAAVPLPVWGGPCWSCRRASWIRTVVEPAAMPRQCGS